MIFQKLEALPDVEINQSATVDFLELQPGWPEQGIERRHDGLWCKLIDPAGDRLCYFRTYRENNGPSLVVFFENLEGLSS